MSATREVTAIAAVDRTWAVESVPGHQVLVVSDLHLSGSRAGRSAGSAARVADAFARFLDEEAAAAEVAGVSLELVIAGI